MVQPKSHKFGDHDLQEVLVWMPQGQSADSVFWIVFIHGGAWRDPKITACNFVEPAMSILFSDTAAHELSIPDGKSLAIASLSYRLSPHPSYPQNPETTPHHSLRIAKHPDHIEDVCSGIAVLGREYGLSDDSYVLVGHSCGGTLAFQALKRHVETGGIPAPRALAGLAGIYDIESLVENHKDGPYAEVYASSIKGAFGDDKKVWAHASPRRSYEHGSRELFSGRTFLLVTANEDDLVEPEQRDGMKYTLAGRHTKNPQIEETQDCRYAEMSVEGGHDEMWQQGERMVKVIQRLFMILSGI
ncbi:hypothetical protein LTR99_001675 [Exophiala xenobiotica]|uniref:Kynurenine formamidase n=1 Tax=Vermiconidia calcicola TaxID=1690605 RepID=A0AAV9QKE2_9PEZI|nr:hypothetical protein LTR92_009010 [Exophiala xenobiotica]KAK5544185.1 hypothetical protein LTR25_001800 [Vermiconidia calcicola]KAK5547534.1 hypothetical protein LTR23_002287 [Chaetothyriales sp. CCFEE 6169]KAK5271167.1 hypothetical protein LTR96_002991 [Exophiala xenobiotica]KAK5308699.1 hypothetical protein LTR99_001675 [Exophiala xenobiotica]